MSHHITARRLTTKQATTIGPAGAAVVRIMRAAEVGRGVVLSPDEVSALSRDQAVQQLANNCFDELGLDEEAGL